jgi:hypothetical protein
MAAIALTSVYSLSDVAAVVTGLRAQERERGAYMTVEHALAIIEVFGMEAAWMAVTVLTTGRHDGRR